MVNAPYRNRFLAGIKIASIIILLFIAVIATSGHLSAATGNPNDDADTLKNNRGWNFGINLGAYFASKYSAGFYSGLPTNENKISLILNNHYYQEEIKRQLNGDTSRLLELPANMKYSPAFNIGFFVKYNFIKNTGVFLNVNFAKLKTNDVFTMGIGPYLNGYSFDNIQTFPIWGIENRTNIDIGFMQMFPTSDYVDFFVEGGLNINNVQVKENKIAIGDLSYSIVDVYGGQNYVPNATLQQYVVRQGGLGFGGFAGVGLRLNFSRTVSIDPGFDFYWTQTNLTGYEAFRPNYSVYVRLCMRNLFGKSNNESL
ncbi:MAG: hypothetical protein WCM76_07275 [Bacteroidota bacterium]